MKKYSIPVVSSSSTVQYCTNKFLNSRLANLAVKDLDACGWYEARNEKK